MIRLVALAILLALGACSPMQSAFHPSGEDAERIAKLFWIMTAGGGIIFLIVLVTIGIAIYGGKARQTISGERFVSIMGIAFPLVVLSALLVYGFVLMGAGNRLEANPDGVRVEIAGELWWWRVTYVLPDGSTVTSANELHVPVGEPVEIALTSTNVIHSFWAPQLAGKLDMIPGRTNMLTITATQPGISRGQCAEYCGGAHALMAFHVVAQTPEEFAAWLEAEAAPALAPEGEAAKRGAETFIETGCGACHTIRGTVSRGVIGPNLTHVGSRHSLAAATLPNTREAFASWITNNQHIKPENKMPPYDILSATQLSDLAIYLEGLK